MDETGQPGGATPGINGNGSHRDPEDARQNETWIDSESRWSSAGAALEPAFEPVLPSWRPDERHPEERREPHRNGHSGPLSSYTDRFASLDYPPEFFRPEASAPEATTSPGGTHSETGYDPAHVEKNGGRVNPAAQTPERAAAESYVPMYAAGVQPPDSAPPYPYEGDLDDDGSRGRVRIPAERPAPQSEQDAPGPPGESLRHRAAEDDTPPRGTPLIGLPVWREAAKAAPPPAGVDQPSGYDLVSDYDPGTGYEPPRPPRFEEPKYPPYAVPRGGTYGAEPETTPAEQGPPPKLSGPAALAPHSPASSPWSSAPASSPPSSSPSASSSSSPTSPSSSFPPSSPSSSFPSSPPSEPRPSGSPVAVASISPAAPPGLPNQRVEPPAEALPQRVPAEPDVPEVPEPEPEVEEPPAQAPELARIWSRLRRDDIQPRPEGFDVPAVIAAVKSVPGVRDAKLRSNQGGGHNLRLELADGADAAQVSRLVARLLQEQMGLSASPKATLAPDLPQAGAPPAGTQASRSPAGTQASGSPAEAQAGGTTVGTQPGGTRGGSQPGGALAGTEASGTRGGTQASGTQAGSPVATQDVVREGRRRAPESPLTEGVARGRAQVETPATQGPVAAPAPGPLDVGERPGPRVMIEQVQVSTSGLDATVEVRLAAGERRAAGVSTGPAVDSFLLRLAADAAVKAINQLLRGDVEATEPRGRAYVEHAAVVPFGSCEIAIAVVFLSCGGWVEQLAGSALVAGDARQAMVRAALAAVNRRLEALLS